MKEERLYIVLPQPHDWVWKATFLPDVQFPWNDVSIAPKIDTHFQMFIDWRRLKNIDLDYFLPQGPVVSQKFASLCTDQGVDFQLISLDVILNGVKVKEKFYFMALNKFVSIVDADRTSHVRMKKMDGTGYEINPFFPDIPEYDMLERIVFNDLKKPPLFIAPEIGSRRVCTQQFKECMEGHGMKGIEFQPIDERFRYESFGFQ
ncbi:hypothetical protein [Trinickia sp. EG282A]|uniref:hypothetical protein n=1 Tax=Trinickia sp. EG282A TaxID=3237013 RepID=UPI0034D3646A